MAFVGINWGSTNLRAYLFDDAGTVRDEFFEPSGIAGLGREGMVAVMERLAQRWPVRGAVYASGMIGSNIGWEEAPYAQAPAGLADIVRKAIPATIGPVELRIIPGIRCTRSFDEGPDILRGEEIELFGLAARHPDLDGLVALPGTHTKWACFRDGRIIEFFTSMSGEMFDRLTAGGLLASIVDGEANDGPAFLDGVRNGCERKLGLGTLLFGARARVICGQLARPDAASYLRGLLIGSEIADAIAIHPDVASRTLPLIGSGKVCHLYARALESVGVTGKPVDSRVACLAGFNALHRAAQ